MNDFEHIYLSAHYDDAVFSCGGTIHRQCREGRRVLVITVFAAPPAPDTRLSALARRLHGRIADPVSVRRAEDRAALARLGAAGHRLSFREAVYRGDPATGKWHYPQLTDLFGAVVPRDEALARAIADAVAPPATDGPGTIFYVPLGIGNHVDHQLVHQTGRRLAERGHAVLFYEDYPYADPAHPASADRDGRFSLAAAVEVLEKQEATALLSPLNEADLAARVEGICAYRSQLDEFRDAAQVIAGHLGRYVRRDDPPIMAERFWRPAEGTAADGRAGGGR